MAAALHTWRTWFWDADFWLPVDSSWQNVEESKNLSWGRNGELYLTFPVAIVLIILRFLFEKFIATPFARYLGVQDKPSVFVPNTFCEKVYQTISKSPNAERIEGLSKQLGWSTREVKRWFKNRRQQSKPSLMRKATESSWRFVFYLATSIYGLVILFKEPWLWDLRHCFFDHGNHPLTDEIYYYYLFETGFYLSLIISLFVDVKRKDFWQMVVHHIVTVLLLVFSYYSGFFRIGSIIVLLHDLADIFLESLNFLFWCKKRGRWDRGWLNMGLMSAKVFNYAKWEATCNIAFILFAVIFNSSRLVYYPFWVLHTVYYSPSYCGPFKAWPYFMGLLLCLQVLHMYWSYKIAEMALSFVRKGTVEGDVRSDEESGPEEEKAESNKVDGILDNKKKLQ